MLNMRPLLLGIISTAYRIFRRTFYYTSEEDLLLHNLQKQTMSPSQQLEKEQHRLLHKKRDTKSI